MTDPPATIELAVMIIVLLLLVVIVVIVVMIVIVIVIIIIVTEVMIIITMRIIPGLPACPASNCPTHPPVLSACSATLGPPARLPV